MTLVKIKKTNQVFRLDRMDKHVHPVCANYRRWRLEDVEIIRSKS